MTMKMKALDKYRENFARDILATNLFIESSVMNELKLTHGHKRLRISFEPYIAKAAAGGVRVIDMAESLSISRQAAKQAADQLIGAGYLSSEISSVDRRSRILTLTGKGERLIKQGGEVVERLRQRMVEVLGETQIRGAEWAAVKLCQSLNVRTFLLGGSSDYQPLAATLPGLADYVTDRLQALTMAKGHPELKRSFGMVLSNIGPHGGRLARIAEEYDVSKQMVSAVAGELEDLGYIQRRFDPGDSRQLVLMLTVRGEQLIEDSISSLVTLEAEFADSIGTQSLNRLKRTLSQLHHTFVNTTERSNVSSLEELAGRLVSELGSAKAAELSRILAIAANGNPKEDESKAI